jgi:hypothetical protein
MRWSRPASVRRTRPAATVLGRRIACTRSPGAVCRVQGRASRLPTVRMRIGRFVSTTPAWVASRTPTARARRSRSATFSRGRARLVCSTPTARTGATARWPWGSVASARPTRSARTSLRRRAIRRRAPVSAAPMAPTAKTQRSRSATRKSRPVWAASPTPTASRPDYPFARAASASRNARRTTTALRPSPRPASLLRANVSSVWMTATV